MARPAGMPNPTIEIVWEAPPERSSHARPSGYDDVIEQVKKTPGRWARIRTLKSQSTSYTARKAFLKRATDPRWEARTAQLEDGSGNYGVWVRYRTVEQMNDSNAK